MNLSEGQRSGAIVMLIAALAVYAASFMADQCPPRPRALPWGEQGAGTAALEVAVGDRNDGIYFVANQTDLLAVLRQAGLSEKLLTPLPDDPTLLKNRAYRLVLGGGGVSLGAMPAASRIALGLPIDLNRASLEDLILVPGIGEKTAAGIIACRRARGPFRNLSDLKLVPGISDARLQGLGAYLQIYGRDL